MPDFPDFDQLALDIVETLLEAVGHDFIRPDGQSKAQSQIAVAEQLRLIWNARGAADIVALKPIIGKLGDTMDHDNARVLVVDRISLVDR